MKKILLSALTAAAFSNPASAQDAETARAFAVIVGVHSACISVRLPGNLSTQLDLMSTGILQGYLPNYYDNATSAAHDRGELDGRNAAAEMGCEVAAQQAIEDLSESW